MQTEVLPVQQQSELVLQAVVAQHEDSPAVQQALPAGIGGWQQASAGESVKKSWQEQGVPSANNGCTHIATIAHQTAVACNNLRVLELLDIGLCTKPGPQ